VLGKYNVWTADSIDWNDSLWFRVSYLQIFLQGVRLTNHSHYFSTVPLHTDSVQRCKATETGIFNFNRIGMCVHHERWFRSVCHRPRWGNVYVEMQSKTAEWWAPVHASAQTGASNYFLCFVSNHFTLKVYTVHVKSPCF